MNMVLMISAMGVFWMSQAAEAINYMSQSYIEPVVRAPTLSESKQEYLRPCYFTNWAQYRQGRGKYKPKEYVPGLCTHILFAFGWMREDFTVKAFDPADLDTSWAKGMYNQVNELKLRDPQLRTLLSVGGWTFGTRLFKAMSKKFEFRKKFIDSAMVFVRQHNFDGFDIDWEYPAGDEDKNNYSLLIKELREAFEEEAKRTNRPRLLISAAVSAGEATIKNAYDIPAIAPYFDFILLMCYDFHGAWETKTGMNSPLFSRKDEIFWQKVWNVEWSANHWHKEGMPKNKIIIGIPTYGRGWTLKDPQNDNGLNAEATGPAKVTKFVGEPGVAAYYEFCEMLSQGAVSIRNDEHKVPYLIHNEDQWFSYDDVESIRLKMQWLKEQQYGGAFVWTLDFDDFNGLCPQHGGQKYPLISVIRQELAGHTVPVEPPPTIVTKPPTPTKKPTDPKKPMVETTTTTEQPDTTMPVLPPIDPRTKDDDCLGMSDGFHPFKKQNKKSKCGKFLLCLNEKTYRMACPGNLEYDSRKGYCTLQENSHCNGGYTTTTVLPATTVTEQTETPTMGTTTETTTHHISTTWPPTGKGDGFECKKPGFFASPTCCNKFFRCVDLGIVGKMKAYEFSCPPPLHFEQKMRVCVHESASKCKLKSIESLECQ